MRALRICSCLLLSGTLLGILGCAKISYTRKGPEVKSDSVTISNCKANPDTVQVPRKHTLIWSVDPSDSHTYKIHFPKNKPIPSADAVPGQGQLVTGDSACNSLGWLNGNYCVYQYNLTQDGSKACPDPGVHVYP